MSTTIDVVIESGHPQWNVLQGQATQFGGSQTTCEGGRWHCAMNAGQADWIVLVDRRAAVTAVDFAALPDCLKMIAPYDTDHVDSETSDSWKAPVWLQPAAASCAAERFVGETCPAAVALCWNNPALYSLVCVRRSALTILPAIRDEHPEPLWDWLVRAAGRPQRLVSATVFTVGDWFVRFEHPAGRIARPESKNGPPTFVPPVPTGAPGLVSRNSVPAMDWLIQHIEQTKPSQFIPDSDQVSIADSVAIKAGLLLWHDAADASHQLSQSIEGLGKRHAGDYWHAILHRREPDYSNAKYWFRQFHLHPVMSELVPYASHALQGIDEGQKWKTRLLGKGSWDPLAFVDLCEACADQEDSLLGVAARRIQAAEMQLLMAATYQDASGMIA